MLRHAAGSGDRAGGANGGAGWMHSAARSRRGHIACRRRAERLVLDVVVVEPGEWWIGYHRAITVSRALAGRRDSGSAAGACRVAGVREDGGGDRSGAACRSPPTMSASRSAVRRAARARRCWIVGCSSRASIRPTVDPAVARASAVSPSAEARQGSAAQRIRRRSLAGGRYEHRA